MLTRVIDYIKRKKYMVVKFKENADYFRAGEYIFDNSLRYIYLKDKKDLEKSAKLFGNPLINPLKRIFAYLVKRFFFQKSFFINDENKVPNFQGTAFFIGIDKVCSGKAFDYVNHKVITFYFTEEEYVFQLENYYFFEAYFKAPKIMMSDYKRLLIMEELIDFECYEQWTEKEKNLVMDRIFGQYIQYFKASKDKVSVNYRKPASLLEELNPNDEARRFIEENTKDKLLAQEFPYLKMHGDLWTPNVLLNKADKEQLYFIDFEYSNQYYFLYDIFWFIQDQVLNYRQVNYLEEYLLGRYDSHLKSIFSIFDLTFDERFRLEYLNVSFLDVYLNRYSYLSKRERKLQLQKFKSMLDRFTIKKSLKELG